MKKRVIQMVIVALLISIAPFMTTQASAATGNEIVKIANSLLGVRYQMGGTTPSGFDCSGYTSYVYKQAGITLPRTSVSQYGTGKAVSKANLQAGDLVFFNNLGPGITHVGIYVGNGRFASAESEGITTSSINDPYYWGRYYVGAKRVISSTTAAVASTPVTDGNFKDVATSHPAYEAIKALNVEGIVGGFPNQEFRPASSITRGQAAAMINRELKLTPKNTSTFSDVGTTHSFSKDIAAMNEAGILQGYTTGRFGINDQLTKSQLAVILDRAFDITSAADNQAHIASIYNDVAASFWAHDSIVALKSIDQTTVFQTSTFSVDEDASRAEFSAALYSSIVAN